MDGRTRTQSMFGNPRGYHKKSIGSPIFDPYSENRDLNSPILRYYSSPSPSSNSTVVVSPLSAVENLMGRSPSSSKVYGTPVQAMEGEEVLVMDGVLVSGRGRSTRSCASGSSSSSGSSGKSRYKREICRSWKDSGHCRHGSKCQFAHGKEELRPNRLTVKSKTEVMVPVVVKAAQPITKTASPIAPKNISKILTTSITYREWSPQDDGIEVSLPCLSTGKPPGRKEVTAYIDKILSCPTTRRRLPVFAEIFRA